MYLTSDEKRINPQREFSRGEMYTSRHLPSVNQTRVFEMIAEKLLPDKPFFASYDRPQAQAAIDNRTPFTEWYLGRHTDTMPTVYERDAGILPRLL
jgi:hypothetical protein